jgi:hypothetical protein
MRKGAKKHNLRIEKFARPIIIQRTGEDDNPDRFVHCTVCDDFAYCRISEDEASVIKVNYYCKKCVDKFLLAQ